MIGIIILIFGVVGCQSNQSNVKNIEDYETTGFVGVENECQSNEIAAKDKYMGKKYKFIGCVRRITSQGITIEALKSGSMIAIEDLSETDIKQLSQLQVVEMAGEISDLTNSKDFYEKLFSCFYKCNDFRRKYFWISG